MQAATFIQTIGKLPRMPFVAGIWLYQKTISPDHGPVFSRILPNGYCQFYPSCSQYGLESYKKHGVIKGTWMTTHRIIRCNPYSAGGDDPVPDKAYLWRHPENPAHADDHVGEQPHKNQLPKENL